VAALLHDIGKVAIPERILKSPNRLTDEEFRLVRQHPMMAVSILDRAGVGMPKVREAATEHHEKIDGSGYPRGIKDISLVGRWWAS
jgi:HD-GYP domain-containing protein (c-di-GMP phosphodiesterase class II)